VTEIIRSRTRTREQHQELAQAVQKYLEKYGVDTRIEQDGRGGVDIIVEGVLKNSPFTWAKNVPDNLAKKFNKKMLGVFNTDVILNPYTRGLQGGSAMYRDYFYEKKGALVYSATALMTKRFHAPADGHEVIHAITSGSNIPQIVIRPQKNKLDGTVGADIYGREFSSDEIHSAYPFSLRTSLRDTEPDVPQVESKKEAFTEQELTILRNSILQGLYETAEPAYELALKPGAIKKSNIYEVGGWGGNRAVTIKTNDNTVNFFFNSDQVNRWKWDQDQNASKKIDWSKDPKTVRAMIERDYLASKRAAKESNWLVQNLTGPEPKLSSYREATKRLVELRDFSIVGDLSASAKEREAAAVRILDAGQGEKTLDLKEKNQLAKKMVQMQKRALKDGKAVDEGVLAVQKSDGSWTSINANNVTKESPADRLFQILQK
jgi:hypothetical protein